MDSMPTKQTLSGAERHQPKPIEQPPSVFAVDDENSLSDGWEEVKQKSKRKEVRKGAEKSVEVFTAQPVYITIGPQCCGKTTYLQRHCGRVIDCSIDDVPGVYYKVNIDDLLYVSDREMQSKHRHSIYGIPLFKRCQEMMAGEQGLILLYLSRAVSFEYLVENFLRLNYKGSDVVRDLYFELLSKIVDEEGAEFSSHTVDVFIREAIFPTGISSAQAALQRTAASSPERPVSWGNTNLRCQDYECALYCAERLGRPVKFIRWGHEMPRVDISELLRRNLLRFLGTGRYIPIEVIEKCLATADSILGVYTSPVALAAGAGYILEPESGKVVMS